MQWQELLSGSIHCSEHGGTGICSAGEYSYCFHRFVTYAEGWVDRLRFEAPVRPTVTSGVAVGSDVNVRGVERHSLNCSRPSQLWCSLPAAAVVVVSARGRICASQDLEAISSVCSAVEHAQP